jgi:hypothetical protein
MHLGAQRGRGRARQRVQAVRPGNASTTVRLGGRHLRSLRVPSKPSAKVPSSPGYPSDTIDNFIRANVVSEGYEL